MQTTSLPWLKLESVSVKLRPVYVYVREWGCGVVGAWGGVVCVCVRMCVYVYMQVGLYVRACIYLVMYAQWKYIGVQTCIFVCMPFAYLFAFVCTYVFFVYVCVSLGINMCVCTYMCVYTCVCACVCVGACVCVCAYVCMCVCDRHSVCPFRHRQCPDSKSDSTVVLNWCYSGVTLVMKLNYSNAAAMCYSDVSVML
jgi:hypothetical protein